jgi:hypothetical protein
VSSIDPVMVPDVAGDAFNAPTSGPRTPRTELRCNAAVVAGDFNCSKLPLSVSLFPSSVAATDPFPLIVACMVRSIGTGESRALNVVRL